MRKRRNSRNQINYLAEREGFEPPLGCPKPDFESAGLLYGFNTVRLGVSAKWRSLMGHVAPCPLWDGENCGGDLWAGYTQTTCRQRTSSPPPARSRTGSPSATSRTGDSMAAWHGATGSASTNGCRRSVWLSWSRAIWGTC